MSLFNAFRSKKRVQMYFSDQSIRYLATNEPSFEGVTAFGEKALPPGIISEGKIVDTDGLALILEQAMEEWNLKKKKVSFIIPNEYILIRQVEVPAVIKENELKTYLNLEIGISIHLPFEQAVLDVIKIGQDEQVQQIALIAAPENLVCQYRDLLEEVGLKPIVADVSSFAYYRLYHHLGYIKETEHLLELQLEQHSMNICVFHQHIPKFFRHLNLSSTLDTGMNQAGWLQEVLAELERISNFYHFSVTQGKHAINRIMLTNTPQGAWQVEQNIEEVLQIPVIQLDGETLQTISAEPIPSCYHSLLGLALREVT